MHVLLETLCMLLFSMLLGWTALLLFLGAKMFRILYCSRPSPNPAVQAFHEHVRNCLRGG